jgi:hypothetical protein
MQFIANEGLRQQKWGFWLVRRGGDDLERTGDIFAPYPALLHF